MSVAFEEVNLHSDSRGFVFEPMDDDSLQHQRNTHVVISQPGAVRGNHYHLNGTEVIAVMGPATVRIEENDQIRDIEIPVNKVYRWVIPPMVAHAIKNTGDQPNILVAFNTVAHDPHHPDVVRKVNVLMERSALLQRTIYLKAIIGSGFRCQQALIEGFRN